MKQADKIVALPGQPADVKLEQYSGYVTVNPDSGKALFYYFIESPEDATKKPLVLWLNGVANMLFLESPIGVGFSYSNSTDDYQMTGDKSTTEDAYIFLLNWLERFPEYKNRDFYITGESYAGRYIPQLANHIVSKNVNNSITINLKGVAIGNPYFDQDINEKGVVDFLYSRYIISKEDRDNIQGMTKIDPCLENYTKTYLNRPEVQDALHANITRLGYEWNFCSTFLDENQWHDTPPTMVPVVNELLSNDLRTWIYSGDVDSVCPVIAVQNFFDKIGLKQMERRRPWFSGKEVAGFVTKYDKTTFVIVRGAGHMVPRDQPRRALLLLSSFLQDKLPTTNPDLPNLDGPDGHDVAEKLYGCSLRLMLLFTSSKLL
ncbi:hypothetical protein LUZ60_000707 [Juncus effusus]|nr:hypothetical protein LUZ60_000707 [Juncus effusus]